MRVLVVEDEPLIAVDIEQVIQEAGYDVAALVATVDDALAFLRGGGCDAAILDANLGGRSAEPVADELNRLNIPFVAISGYSVDQRPLAFRAAPFLSKPFKPRLLISALAGLKR